MESVDLRLEPIAVGDCAVVRVTGEIDAFTAPGLRDVLNSPSSDHVVVDLRGVAFLDSTGLGVLIGAVKRLQKRDGTLKIVTDRSGRVRRLFEITSLTRAFEMRTSVLAAIADDAHWQAAIGRSVADWCREHELVLVPAPPARGSLARSLCDDAGNSKSGCDRKLPLMLPLTTPNVRSRS